jgi:gas vesicle protein
MTTKKTAPKFTPDMCERLVELGKLGSSQKMMWADLGISKTTAETWKKKHPEFAEALDLALVHSQAFWERELLANVGNKNFNSRLAEIALRGQFQSDYRDTREQKIDVKADVVVDFSGAVNDLIKQLKDAKE